MHYLTLALDAAAHGDHACGDHRAAEPVEHLWPHHEIGDTRLVLEGDEHDPLGAARTLTHQHQPGHLEPAAIARLHGLGAGGDPTRLEVGAKKSDRMPAQRQSNMAIVFDHLAPGRHCSAMGASSISGIAAPSRASAAAKSGRGSSRSALIAQSASRRARPSVGRKASASASWTSAFCGMDARRQRSSTEAKGWSARAATIAAAWALAKPFTMRIPSRTAKRRSSEVASRVQSHREALMRTG